MLQEDKTLLEKVKNSDKVAFKKLFFNYHDTLSRFVLYKVQDKDIAEDITQETFLSCLLYTSPSPRDATLSRMPSSAWKKIK